MPGCVLTCWISFHQTLPADAAAAVRNRIAEAGLEAARKSKPAAFMEPGLARLVTTGNFEDDLSLLADCDWIIEAVVENLDLKRALLRKVEAVRKPGTIITTNTSGLPVHSIAEGFSDDFRRHWFGTHFFNPPRYMRLLEIIPTPESDPAAVEAIAQFASIRLGKGIVYAKDTPNFIANRIGTFSVVNIVRLMQEFDFSIEDVDALTGSAIGFPKSATFRTIDMVGLDVLGHVVQECQAPRARARRSGRPAMSSCSMSVAILNCRPSTIRWSSASCWATKPGRASTKRSAAPRAKSGWRWIGRLSNTIPRSVPSFLRWRWRRTSIRSASGCAC